MYVSRLEFHAIPGRTHEIEEALHDLQRMVADAGGLHPRVLRSHMASLGAPDIVFEQEARDLAELEREIGLVTADGRFQQWSAGVSSLLAESPKREIYEIASDGLAPS